MCWKVLVLACVSKVTSRSQAIIATAVTLKSSYSNKKAFSRLAALIFGWRWLSWKSIYYPKRKYLMEDLNWCSSHFCHDDRDAFLGQESIHCWPHAAVAGPQPSLLLWGGLDFLLGMSGENLPFYRSFLASLAWQAVCKPSIFFKSHPTGIEMETLVPLWMFRAWKHEPGDDKINGGECFHKVCRDKIWTCFMSFFFFGHLTYFLFIYFKLSIHLLPVVTDVYLLVTLISKYMGTYWWIRET